MTPAELTEWIDAHAATLTLLARQHCDDPEAVVQVAFSQLVPKSASIRDPVAWLYRVVRNGAIDAGRSERRRKQRERSRAKLEVWFDGDAADAAEAVAALETLPAEQREAIVLRIWSGLTLEQIAAACDCSVSSVHRRYEAGIQTLRERFSAAWPTM